MADDARRRYGTAETGTPIPGDPPHARDVRPAVATPQGATPTPDDLFSFSLAWGDVFRRLGWSTLSTIAIRGKGIVTMPLGLIVLGAAGYGEFTVVLATATALVPILLLNLPDGAGRLVVGAPDPDQSKYRLYLIRRAGITSALAASVACLVAWIAFQDEVAAWSAAIAGVLILMKVGTVHLEYFQRTRRLVTLLIAAEYGAIVLGLGLAIVFGVSGMLIGHVVALSTVALLAARTVDVREESDNESASLFYKAAFSLALPLLPVALAQWALVSLDALLIYLILGAADAGAYSAAYSVAAVGLLLPLALNPVWFPTAVRLISESTRRAFRLASVLVVIVVAAGAALVLAFIAAQPLLDSALQDTELRNAPACVPWIIAGFAFLALGKVAEGLLYAAGRIRQIVLATVFGASVNVIGNLAWIPEQGIIGAAHATTVGYLALAAMMGMLAMPLRRSP